MFSDRKPIVVVGSINMDLIATAERIPAAGETVLATNFETHPGGKGANQAVAIGKLGYPVRMIGQVGSDTFGNQLIRQLQSAGVDTSAVATTEGSSGVALIAVSREGENSIVVAQGANALLTPQYLEAQIEIIRRAGLVLTQLEVPLETVDCLARLCAREGVPMMLDPAPARELPPDLLKLVDWFTPNETEAGFYTADAKGSEGITDPAATAQKLLSRGPKNLLLKMGSRGVYLATENGPGKWLAAFPVEAVDTTGAGDAFNGAFATALMTGKDPVESARFATVAAAISVTRHGAQPSMPSLSEVEHLMRIQHGQ